MPTDLANLDPPAHLRPGGFDPPAGAPDDPADEVRMSLGEHLDELRLRLVRALLGFVIAFVVCLVFSRSHTLPFFAAPLLKVLIENDISPQLYVTGAADPFVVYVKVSLIGGAVLASPWIVWQAWAFVAAGLYARERKAVTRYVPLSIGLVVAAVSFVYWVVLPMTLQFFVAFAATIPMPDQFQPDPSPMSATQQAAEGLSLASVPSYRADPVEPQPYQFWFNESQQRLKIFVDGRVRVVQLLPENLVSPLITLPGYIDLVMMMLATFAVSFQLPLGVLAVGALNIATLEELRGARKMVYFVMVIAAAVITPGDALTATVALLVPLAGLYELGLVLVAARGKRGETPV